MRPNLYTVLERGLAQTLRYGPGLLLHRYGTRPRILKTRPVPCPDDAEIEVHTMVCRRDWLNGVWTLKSFRAAAGQPFRLVIFHDGSLTARDEQCLRDHFPGVHLPTAAEVAPLVEQRLAPIAPTIAELWRSGRCFILRKAVDSPLVARRRFVLKIDPDVLFFQRPEELLNPEATLAGRYAAYNVHRHRTHRDGMYCFDPVKLNAQFGLDLPTEFNEGLGVVDTSRTDWPMVERIFAALPLQEDLLFLTAQTIEAIFCVQHGFVPLSPDRYNVEHDDVAVNEQTVARHYLSKMRDRFYVEGIPRLLADSTAQKFIAELA
jgi:hypothetical protein